MQFDSFAEFIAMGGYGFYVWLSFGVSFALLTLLVFFSRADRKKVIQHIQQQQKRKIKLKQAAQLAQGAANSVIEVSQ
jgi:heme exporter protein D